MGLVQLLRGSGLLAGLSWCRCGPGPTGLRWVCGSAGTGAGASAGAQCTTGAGWTCGALAASVAEWPAGWTMGMGTEGTAYGAACQAAGCVRLRGS